MFIDFDNSLAYNLCDDEASTHIATLLRELKSHRIIESNSVEIAFRGQRESIRELVHQFHGLSFVNEIFVCQPCECEILSILFQFDLPGAGLCAAYPFAADL